MFMLDNIKHFAILSNGTEIWKLKLNACAVHTHLHQFARDRVIACCSFISHLMDSGLAHSQQSHPLLVSNYIYP